MTQIPGRENTLHRETDRAVEVVSDRDLRVVPIHKRPQSMTVLVTTVFTSVKIEIRCRDDTVPKTVDTRSHCKVWLRACNNPKKPRCWVLGLRKIVACSQPYLAVASCIYSFWHGVIPTSHFIFTLVSLIFSALPRATYLLFMSMPAQGYDAISERI